ncbi:MAG: ABC transporter ATP-binding protein [Sorangiineae bacterium]|nr:ABC transporter ATP-binding protein [Polyangiaceae bacterium]MEB2323023.1 ABC transporter ATP-binding protein [Sorangiineae bacterium]
MTARPRSSDAPVAGRAAPTPGLRTEAALSAFHEEAKLGRAQDFRLLLRLWPFVAPHRRLMFVALGVMALTAGTALVRPLIMRFAIDHGVTVHRPSVLLEGGLILAVVVVVEQVLTFAQIYATQIVGVRAMTDLRRRIFEFIHGLRLGYFDNQPVGRLVTRVTNDVDAVLELFASGALSAFGDLIRLIGIVALMLALDWKLSLVAFAATPPVAILVLAVRRRAREAYRDIRTKTARMNANMNEQVTGMTVVQAYGHEAGAAREFDEINAGYRDANIRAITYESVQDAAIDTVSAVCLASLVVSLGYHPVSFGTLVAFNAYVVQFFEPISALAQRYTLLQSALAGAERIFGLLDTDAADEPRGEPAPRKVSDAAFELEHVGFAYKPGVPVLEDVSFQARRGERIALVGPTGAGKTTISGLLLRLYEAETGVVRVMGDDVRALERDELRRRFAVVPQDVFLFPGTIATNVAASSKPDRARVREVLERIEAWELFASRPGGVDAPIDEQGSNFSAGERQLIAFARALYRDAPILMLDEATASVDSATEARLQRALGELLAGRTSLIIAHRLSTIRAADRIVVFQRGRVVEQGSHDELLALGGLYARLYELQFARAEAGAEPARALA